MEGFEEAMIGAREREVVSVAVDAHPLRGLPIPSCSILAIAVAKRSPQGPFLLYLGTDNGHLLYYTLSDSTLSVSSSSSASSELAPKVGYLSQTGAAAQKNNFVGSPDELVLRKRRIMGKAPIESLCVLPASKRIAILYDGQVSLLDMGSLGALERLGATKGASALTRAALAPAPSRSLNSTSEEQWESELPSGAGFKMNSSGFVGKLGMGFGRQAFQPDLYLGGMSSFRMEGTSKMAVSVKRKILLYEVRAVESPPQGEKSVGKERRSSNGWDDATTVSTTKLQEIVSVEGVLTMVWLENVIIAGTQQEYVLFSLNTGESTVLFSLPQDLPYPPLLKLFPKDLEVLLLVDNVGILVNAEGQPTAGSLVFSTVPEAIGQTPPYVLVVRQGYTELHHRKTGAKIQNLKLAGVGKGRCLVADDDGGSIIVIASASKIWCLKQVSLDEQVHDLLKQRQFNEAVRLAEEAVAAGDGDVAKERLAIVHAEAGFLLLFDLHFDEAMDHFLLSDILQPLELFPFFPSFTSRWRNLIPRKRYWGLHPPQQPIQTVIEDGLLAIQSGLLVLATEPKVLELLAQGPSAKAALVDHYLVSSMQSFARYLRVVRERELNEVVKEGVDTLLLRLYSELRLTKELEQLSSAPNSCVLEEVETVLKAAAQLRPLALLYESKWLFSSALQVWQTLALENCTTDLHIVAASEAARLLESSSDSGVVLQHTGWILRLDPNLALNVLTSSKRSQALPPGDVLTLLNDEGGHVRQRYLQWLVQEKGSEATVYHTELALSLAKAALETLSSASDATGKEEGNEGLQRDNGILSRRLSMRPDVVRNMLQTFLSASDKYEADEVLSAIQGSELWREQVRMLTHC